jgi:FAD/FMN-containing dehydrogenase
VNRRLASAPLALVTVLLMSGCTGAPQPSSSTASDAPGDDGQSIADACAIVQSSIDEATSAFSSASPEDPGAVVSALQEASAELAEVAPQVTNDEVAALLAPLGDMFAQAAEAMEALGRGDVTRVGEISELSGSLQESAAAYQELCAAG